MWWRHVDLVETVPRHGAREDALFVGAREIARLRYGILDGVLLFLILVVAVVAGLWRRGVPGGNVRLNKQIGQRRTGRKLALLIETQPSLPRRRRRSCSRR